MTKIVIVVEGGVVRAVVSGIPVEVVVVDRDHDGCDMVTMIEGKTADVSQTPDVFVDQDRLDQIIQQAETEAIPA